MFVQIGEGAAIDFVRHDGLANHIPLAAELNDLAVRERGRAIISPVVVHESILFSFSRTKSQPSPKDCCSLINKAILGKLMMRQPSRIASATVWYGQPSGFSGPFCCCLLTTIL